ncbi:MAG: GatB/YqeY domain-containing protein [Bacteroidota bacterium]
MSLVETINNDIKAAMMAKEEVSLRGLRAIKAAILIAQTEPGASKELSEEKEIQLLQKLVKQRKDSIAIYQQQNREDLATKEIEEVSIIEKYLPKQLNEEEMTSIIKKIITDTAAVGMKDMGKVMGLANKEMAGKADGSKISQIVKQLLSN